MWISDKFINELIIKDQAIHDEAYTKARACLLDYLGVTLGGYQYLKAKNVKLIESLQNHSILETALWEGFAAHVLELDDGHRRGMIHLGASIITAVIEVAKQEHLNSKMMLEGIIMGYEAAIRCAMSIQPGHKVRGYHVSGTCGTIGAALGIAFACGYNREQLKSTLDCAVTSAAGVLEIQEQASELKPYNIARAVCDGLLAAQIGKLAIPGPDDIIGGKRGFLAAMTDTPKPEYLTEFNDERFCIEGIYQKVHAACRHNHPAIDATILMRNDLDLKPEQVEKIEVYTYKLAVGSHDHTKIQGISSAKLSTPFAVAMAIVKGSCGYADYNEDNLNDYWIKYLTNKVKVIEDKNLTDQSPSIRGARVVIYLKNGEEYEASCLYPKGEPENPLTQADIENKFRELAMYGGLSSEECDEVVAAIKTNDFDLDKIREICKL